MDQRPENPSRNDDAHSTQEWFEAIDRPQTAAPADAVPRKRRRGVLAIFIVLAVVLLAGVVIGLVVLPHGKHQTAANCFNKNGYESLLTIIRTVDDDEIRLNDVQPQMTLYTHTVYFADKSATYSTDDGIDSAAFLRKVGINWQKEHAVAPITVHLAISYLAGDSPELARERLDAVKRTLTDAGMNESAITTSQPTPFQPGDSTDDDDVTDGLPVTISIVPSPNAMKDKCRIEYKYDQAQ